MGAQQNSAFNETAMTSIYWVFKWHRPPRDATCHSLSMVRDGVYQMS